jgi:hypothetical protein
MVVMEDVVVDEPKELQDEIKRRNELFEFIKDECDWEPDSRIRDACIKGLSQPPPDV